jgi:signal peptidase I
MHDHDTQVKKESNFWVELLKLAVVAAIIVIPFRKWVAQPFIVDGASMDPTFKNGQYLIVDELTYHFKTPARGSVLIFRYPLEESKYFIKRVIGLPGETVDIKSGQVSIDGVPLDEPYVKFPKDDTSSYTLGADQYFVMGDNRFGSADSRYWGPVPAKDIIGRPIIRFSPPSLWPGDETQNNRLSDALDEDLTKISTTTQTQ